MQKRYILTGYLDTIYFGKVFHNIAESNSFETIQILLENLMYFDLVVDVYDCELKKIVLSSNHYAPPKQK
jgi:hypothetical protein